MFQNNVSEPKNTIPERISNNLQDDHEIEHQIIMVFVYKLYRLYKKTGQCSRQNVYKSKVYII